MVVAPTERGRFLRGCLAALDHQRDAPELEVIVPVDGSVANLDALRSEHPRVRFIELPELTALALDPDLGRAHRAIDRRRAAGLAAARGPIVALTEEHARPAADWCRKICEAHRQPHAAIGGAVENARNRALNWALFFSDAGRYAAPLEDGPSSHLTDLNVSYKRPALDAVRETWREEYREMRLHEALRAHGESLWLSGSFVVSQDRGQLALGSALRERFAWARLYAGRRSLGLPTAARGVLCLGSPLLVLLLPLRQAREVLGRRGQRGPFLRALPLLVLMAAARAAGEALGYATGRATPSGGARASSGP